MDFFAYRDGALHAEDVPVAAIAAAAGTPCFIYSKRTLVEHLDRFRAAFVELDPRICYSIKSCGNLSILRILGALGAGMDVVSGGELARATAAGIPASACTFAGVGKSDREIADALRAGIGLLNCESEEEFENVARIADALRTEVRVALRINPDVDPKTHRYTSTGRKETKFGVDLERARRFFARHGRARHARLEGLHLHIGSPVLSVDPYREAIEKTAALIDDLTRDGFSIRTLDLGGGFGADYESGQSPSHRDYADAILPVARELRARGIEFVLEPGRTIVANAGILVVRVAYTKTSGERRFAICDAGMNALLRPSHYGSFHFIWPVEPGPALVPTIRAPDPGVAGTVAQDVVGPLCESGDFLATDRLLPASVARGDLLAIHSAGAYGMSMASRYNSTPLPAEVLVDGASATLVRRRERIEELFAHELDPMPLATDLAGTRPLQPELAEPSR